MTAAQPAQEQQRAAKPHIGRPSVFTAQAAEEICERIAGGEALVKICKDPHLPSRMTIYEWLRGRSGPQLPDYEDPPQEEQQENTEMQAFLHFSDNYARACEADGDREAAEVIELADSIAQNDDGTPRNASMAQVQAVKLQLDARKWSSAHKNRRKWGEQVDIATTNTHIVTTAKRIPLDTLEPGQREQLLGIAHKLLRSGTKDEQA